MYFKEILTLWKFDKHFRNVILSGLMAITDIDLMSSKVPLYKRRKPTYILTQINYACNYKQIRNYYNIFMWVFKG